MLGSNQHSCRVPASREPAIAVQAGKSLGVAVTGRPGLDGVEVSVGGGHDGLALGDRSRDGGGQSVEPHDRLVCATDDATDPQLSKQSPD